MQVQNQLAEADDLGKGDFHHGCVHGRQLRPRRAQVRGDEEAVAALYVDDATIFRKGCRPSEVGNALPLLRLEEPGAFPRADQDALSLLVDVEDVQALQFRNAAVFAPTQVKQPLARPDVHLLIACKQGALDLSQATGAGLVAGKPPAGHAHAAQAPAAEMLQQDRGHAHEHREDQCEDGGPGMPAANAFLVASLHLSAAPGRALVHRFCLLKGRIHRL